MIATLIIEVVQLIAALIIEVVQLIAALIIEVVQLIAALIIEVVQLIAAEAGDLRYYSVFQKKHVLLFFCLFKKTMFSCLNLSPFQN